MSRGLSRTIEGETASQRNARVDDGDSGADHTDLRTTGTCCSSAERGKRRNQTCVRRDESRPAAIALSPHFLRAIAHRASVTRSEHPSTESVNPSLWHRAGRTTAASRKLDRQPSRTLRISRPLTDAGCERTSAARIGRAASKHEPQRLGNRKPPRQPGSSSSLQLSGRAYRTQPRHELLHAHAGRHQRGTHR